MVRVLAPAFSTLALNVSDLSQNAPWLPRRTTASDVFPGAMVPMGVPLMLTFRLVPSLEAKAR